MFIVNIAEILIAIDNKYEFVKKQCTAYIVESFHYDFSVSVTEDDIKTEQDSCENISSVEIVESICLYRKIAQQLPYYNAFIMHGAAIEYNGKSICFTAKSGTGKTTHIGLWRKTFGNSVNIINGDKPIFRYTEDGFRVYGTPWSGKENYNRNTSAPLKAICILERGKNNSINKIQVHNALNFLLKQIYIPTNDINAYEKSINLLDKLMRYSDIWQLRCTISNEAAIVARDAIFNND